MKAGTPGARPTNDPFSRALMAAAANEMPSWFVASNEREMTRVAEIAKEMGLKSPVVVGARKATAIVAALKSSGATAVVSLEWPSADSVTGHEFLLHGIGQGRAGDDRRSGGDTQVKANAATLREGRCAGGARVVRRRERRDVPRSRALDDRSGHERRRRAPRDDGHAGGAARHHVARSARSRSGKLANLVVVTGNDLFASGTPIKHVFVEGRLY